MIPRGREEVKCSIENGYMLHDWAKVQASPVFTRGFKPMDGHDKVAESPQPVIPLSEHAEISMAREQLGDTRQVLTTAE